MMTEVDSAAMIARRAARPLYREVIADSTPSVLVNMADGVILESSHVVSSMFGYLDDEMIGKTIYHLMPERFREAHRKHFENYKKDPHVRSMGEAKTELFGIAKNGTEFQIEIILVPTWKLGFLAVVATILKRRNP